MIPVALNVGNPLPRADPLFRPMHRTCLDRGCQHRGRLVTYSGWILALIFTGAFVLMVYAHRGLRDRRLVEILGSRGHFSRRILPAAQNGMQLSRLCEAPDIIGGASQAGAPH
jgi:hypothetical protein